MRRWEATRLMSGDEQTTQQSAEDLVATLADHQRQLDDLSRALAAQQRMLDAHERTLGSRDGRQ